MSFRLVPKLVTLNDLERQNGPYFALFHRSRSLYAIAIPSVVSLSVVCRLKRLCALLSRLKFLAIFLRRTIAQGL